jgi:hypothetical protein
MSLQFSFKFPFITFKKKIIVYEKHTTGDNLTPVNLIKINRDLLLDNQVPINKIRFITTFEFEYDVDNDIINPKYDILLPVNLDNGLVDKSEPIIEVKKPMNSIKVMLNLYEPNDNYQMIKSIVKKSKRGVVIGLYDGYDVNSYIISLIDLDEAVENNDTLPF